MGLILSVTAFCHMHEHKELDDRLENRQGHNDCDDYRHRKSRIQTNP